MWAFLNNTQNFFSWTFPMFTLAQMILIVRDGLKIFPQILTKFKRID